jgi:photosystem II stability/assembly factor-like uncharacterized protein
MRIREFTLVLATCLGCAFSTGGDPLPGYGGAGGQVSGGGGQINGGGGAAGAVAGDATWISATTNLAGLQSECGNISSISSRPDRDMIIVGVARQGLWASADGSPMWTKLGQGPGSATIINRMSSVVYDPAHPDTFWESGIYNGSGIYRTTDNGVTFEQLGDATHNDMVAVDFSDPERKLLLAGGHEQFGRLLRSTDGGKTWTDIGKKLPPDAGASSLPVIIDSRTFLLGTYNARTGGVFRSTDAGESWSQVEMGEVTAPPLIGFDGAFFWAHPGSGGIRSTDKGLTWTELGNTPRMGTMVVELPDHRLIASYEKQAVISADRGATWRNLGPLLPWNATGVLYSPFRKAVYAWHFICADGPIDGDQIMRLDFDYQKK